ncbi:putative 2-aminoethylphosphonate ABC transporter ATP-binding protein [Oceanospirillum beijerinckii]|uniref:putative 2-aminoethylphosphonate ABC transporter ATP-binding protein n=1 Tax=Oceanospirillum beijerinckii TaxID=64976 RepID=UPI000415DDC5|nr:putative 2-aminoethylphosphonate ABC transporter ATP-binding protein [Oceanospirillum beijerinckii]
MTALVQQPLPHTGPQGSRKLGVPYLQVNKLWKHYGNFAALKEISLEINEGEFVCFLGPSGCGKTTLLRAIAGLDPQSKGEIFQGGSNISRLPPEQRDFGIVFQSYALFPNLSVADNIAYGLHSQNMSRQKVDLKVRDLLDTIGLPDVAKKYPAQLSGGQQQRIALARALATEPSLLLLDEPLSALDARVRLHLRQEIRNLQRQLGITTIMVTHDQEEALSMADRIVVMNHGVIEQVGTPEEVYRRPANAFVANFVGTMNLLPTKASSNQQVRMADRIIRCMHYKAESMDATWLAFRPEVAQLVATGDSKASLRGNEADLECFAGTVMNTEFLGNFLRVEVALMKADQVVKIDVSTQDANLKHCCPGQDVEVCVAVNNLQVYKRYEGNSPANTGTNTSANNTSSTGKQTAGAAS